MAETLLEAVGTMTREPFEFHATVAGEPTGGDLVHEGVIRSIGDAPEDTVQKGVISDVDSQGCFGLIESDDGEIVLFGRESLSPSCKRQGLHIGLRVEFSIDTIEPAPHASSVVPAKHH